MDLTLPMLTKPRTRLTVPLLTKTGLSKNEPDQTKNRT